jgi:hypothetical protein
LMPPVSGQQQTIAKLGRRSGKLELIREGDRAVKSSASLGT